MKFYSFNFTYAIIMKIFSYIAQIACLVLYLVQFCVVQFRFI